jgi:hypothetical protein
LNISTLDAYRKRRRQARSEKGGTPRWVAVEVQDPKGLRRDAAGSGLALRLARGRRIEVERGFDAATLERLLSVLERA